MIGSLLQLILWTALMAAVLLMPAGTIFYPGGLAFIALMLVGGWATIAWLHKYSPSLLRERMSSPVQRAQKPWDRVFLILFMPSFLAWMAFMAWDAARTGFTAVPPWLQ